MFSFVRSHFRHSCRVLFELWLIYAFRSQEKFSWAAAIAALKAPQVLFMTAIFFPAGATLFAIAYFAPSKPFSVYFSMVKKYLVEFCLYSRRCLAWIHRHRHSANVCSTIRLRIRRFNHHKLLE